MSGVIGVSPDSNSGIVGSFPIGHVVQTVTGTASTTNYQGTDRSTITCTNWTSSIDKIYGDESNILVQGTYAYNLYQGNVTSACELDVWIRRTTQTAANLGDNRHYGPQDEGGDTYHNIYGMASIQVIDTTDDVGTHTYVGQCAPGSTASGTPSGGINNTGVSRLVLYEIMVI